MSSTAIAAITAIGVDVAKTSLVFAGPCARSTSSVLNQPAVLRAYLLAIRAAHPAAHLVCEATGGCERLLVATAHALKIPVSVLEPGRVRHFAQSLGRWEKTDPIDAGVLREFGQRMPLKATEQLENNYQVLRDWVQLRDHLVERLKVEQTFLKSLPNAKMQAVIAAECRHLQRQIEKVEAQIETFLQTQAPELGDRVQTLCLVEGVATRGATALLAYMPELGRLEDSATSKLAGVAPLADDSGTREGPRHIAKGRAPVRRILYMLALVAARYNPHLRPYYLHLRAAGKPPKVALIAVARKLLIFLNRILKPAFVEPV